MSLSRAVDVNEAFRLLRDPIRRAEALLRKAGALAAEGAEPKASPALLMEMMEVREELSEARQAKDLGRIAQLGAGMRAREQAVLAGIGRAFEAAGGDLEKTKAILPALGELRYLRRFLDEVSAIEEDLAP
jgi:molecular chaperone HscB